MRRADYSRLPFFRRSLANNLERKGKAGQGTVDGAGSKDTDTDIDTDIDTDTEHRTQNTDTG